MSVEIPGYKIIRTLGQGGMATVYLAVQEIFDRQVAIKVMAKSLTEDPAFGKRFMREAQIVSQLVHPNIVTVYDAGVHDDAYYISMEYIDGSDLKHISKRLSFRQKINVITDMAKALNFAGSKGYVHRDVKPENIMLDASKDRRAVLMDFGIARAAEVDLSMTQVGTAIGTPHYMSPEQAKGKPVDTRSDIYSLGVVFYWLLLGRVPFDAESAVAIGIRHLTEPVPVLPDHLDPLQFILDGMLAKQPEDRFQNGAELVAALDIVDIYQLELEHKSYEQNQGDSIDSEHITLSTVSSHSEIRRIANATAAAKTHETSINRFTLSYDVDTSLSVKLFKSVWVWILLAGIAVTSGYWFSTVKNDNSIPQFQQVIAGVPVYDNLKSTQAQIAELVLGKRDPQDPKNAQYVELLDKLQGLEKRYQNKGDSYKNLVMVYREIVSVVDNKDVFEQQIEKISREQFAYIQALFNRGKFRKAKEAFSIYKKVFPKADHKRMDERFAKAGEIAKQLKKAETYFARGDLTQPKNKNAYDAYRRVLRLDKDIYPAEQGLKNIANKLVVMAERGHKRGDIALSEELIEKALTIDTYNPEALALKARFKGNLNVNTRVGDLLEEADRRIFEEKYYQPRGDSAYDLYAQILVLDNDNLQAKNGLKKLLALTEDRAIALVREKKYDAARLSLNAINEQRKGDGEVQLLLFKVDEAITESRYNDRPSVSLLRANGSKDIDLKAPQKDNIQVTKTIFLVFRFENFNAEGGVLNATLYDAKRRRKLGEVPVVVNRSKGVGDFVFNHGKNGFGSGEYSVELHYLDKRLASVAFSIP